MDEFTQLRQVRQIAQFPLLTSITGVEIALLQAGGLGGPYQSIAVSDLVGWGLASGGTLRLATGEAIQWNGTLSAPVTLRAGPQGFSFSAPVYVSGNLDAVGLSVAGQPVATHSQVQDSFNFLLANSVSSWNGRTGAVELLTEDILRAGGAPADNPVFSGRVVGPTHWNPALCDDTLVTSAWVQSALCAGLWTFAASPYFYGSPTASTPPAGDYSLRIANTIWVTGELDQLRWDLGQVAVDLSGYAPLASPAFTGIPTAPTAAQTSNSGQLATTAFVHNAVVAATAGVASFNGRTGAVTLTTLDVTTAGGAPLAAPAFTGVATAPTPAPGTSSTVIATTAFVMAAIAAAGAGVISFNSRTGAVVLTAADVTGVGGALLASPVFTGTPAGPTAVPGTSTTQLATTAFVAAAITATGPVISFNGRSGAVTLQASDVSAAGGALLVSPAFTGTPTAPTPAPGTSSTVIATTAFVAAAVAGVVSGVSSFNGRAGAVTLTAADVTGAGGAPIASPIFTGVPAGPNPAPGTNSTQLATTAFVAAAMAAGVTSFNGRTGAVAFQAADISAVGGALLASPAFTGTPTAPTQAPGTSNTDIATTAFVAAAVAGGAAGVSSFNTRVGAVTLSSADVSGAGGALLASPAFTGTPTAPTAVAGNSSTQLATTAFVAGAGIPINVNTLTTTPLVGDGNTSNLAAWQQVVQNMSNLNTSAPVAVTLANGSPCVVTLNSHNFKPNQAFRFSSLSTTLPTGVSLGTTYFVTAANQTLNTFTFTTVNNATYVTGQAEGAPVNTTGTSSGVQIVPMSAEWINLYVPPGVYATNPPFGSAVIRTPVELFPMGISKVRFWAYGCVFDDLTVVGPTGTANGYMAMPGPSPNGWVNQWYDYILSIKSGGGPSSANYQITLKTIANAVNYYPGQWIAVLALDLMNQYNHFVSGPPNNHYCEFNQVTAVNTGTGVISLRYPPKFVYSDTFPVMFNGTAGAGPGAVIGGGAAMIVPMNPAWDIEMEVLGARFPISTNQQTARRQVYIDCRWDGVWAPHVGREIIYRRCRMVNQNNQIDKMMEYLEFDTCEVYLPFSSTSVIQCVMKACRGTVINTPRNLVMEDSIIDQMQIGTQVFGTTDSIIMKNNRVNFFTLARRSDAPLLGASTGGNAILANWTFSNGTFSRDLSTVTQAYSYQPWAIPGAKCFLNDEAGIFSNMGSPFMILNVYMTGSVFKFDTTLKAIPTLQASSAVTVTIASPAVFTGPTLANGTPVLLQTTGALPTGFTAGTAVYFVVNTSGTTFQLSASSGGAAINSSGTQSGVHTAVANPLHINIHPCPRFTAIGNAGVQAVTDMNGAIDEPIYSRFKRAFAGKQATNTVYQNPQVRIWGKLISMTVNVFQAGTAGTVAITCPGFTQPNLATSNFSQTVDLTIAGTRTVTPAAVTGSAGVDVLAVYGDWLCGGIPISGANVPSSALQIATTGVSATLSNTPVFDVEILTDQGITRFTTVFGGDTQTNAAAINTMVDSSIQQYWPAVN